MHNGHQKAEVRELRKKNKKSKDFWMTAGQPDGTLGGLFPRAVLALPGCFAAARRQQAALGGATPALS